MSVLIIARFFFLFFKNFCWTHVNFLGNWYLCFRLLVISPLGFIAKVVSALFKICGGVCVTCSLKFHLWCNSSAGVYNHYSSWSLSSYACFSRGRMTDLNHRTPTWEADALTTQKQWPGILLDSYVWDLNNPFTIKHFHLLALLSFWVKIFWENSNNRKQYDGELRAKRS